MIHLWFANICFRLFPDYNYFSRRFIKDKRKISPELFHTGITRAIQWWNACVQKYPDVRKCMYGPGPKDLPKIITGLPTIRCWRPFETGNICGYFRIGFYYYMIRDWLTVFPREQFLFIRSEDFAKNPADVIYEQILPFLNISTHDINKSIFHDATQTSKRSKRMVNTNQNNTMQYKKKYEPMLNTTRELLYELYRKPTQQLSELLSDKRYLWSDITNAYLWPKWMKYLPQCVPS